MTRNRSCHQCGAELPANAPQGLCPRCLAGMGMGLLRTVAMPELDFQFERTGVLIGRYKLLEQIGEGGFGVVYMAQQEEPVQRKVALKIIKAGMDSREVVARFEAERQALALMDHPNIARVLDGGETAAGRPYFVMELVRGIPITEYCDQGKLCTRERLQLFIKVCHAVQHAHQKGVIHRDLKPTNVLVTQHDGEPVPKVIDFGVAKALAQKLTERTLFTAFQQMVGTPAYMSPEQAALSGLDVDTRADVYSLGVLLYELLTGVTPLDADTFRKAALDEIRRMIQETEPPKPSTRLETLGEKLKEVARHRHTEPALLSRLIRGDLDWIAMKCLEKDRTRRYETANALARDLERHLNVEPIAARPPGNVYRLQKLVRRHKLAFAAATAVATALVLGLGVSTWALLRESEARRTAVSAGRKADSEAELAAIRAREATMTLATSDFLESVQLVAEKQSPGGAVQGSGQPPDRSDALPYLVRSLSANPTNAGALTRLATLLTHYSWIVPRLTLKQDNQATGAEFSADGEQVVTISGDSAIIWDAQTGRRLAEVLTRGKEINAVQFSPDGKRIAIASGNEVGLWDAQSGRPLGEPLRLDHRVNVVQFSPDGAQIITAAGVPTRDREQTVDSPGGSSAQVWDAGSGKSLTPELKHGGRVNSARFSLDGKRIATASDDKTACVWEADSGRLLVGPLKHSGKVVYAEFNADGGRIVTVAEGNLVSVWDAQSGELLKAPFDFEGRGWTISAHFSRGGTRILTCPNEYTVMVWDAQNGQPLTDPMRHGGLIDSAQFSLDGRLILVIATDYTVFDDDADSWCKSAQVWDAQTGKPVTPPLHHAGAWSAQFSPNGKRVITISSNKTAVVWNVPTPAVTERLKHNSPVLSAEFSPDGKRIATVSSDGTLRVWDAQSGALLPGPAGDGGKLTSARFSPDGTRIVTASQNGMAHVWDALTGKLLIEPLRHADEVTWAEFGPDGKWIVTASKDKTARVWDAQSGRPRTEPLAHPGPVGSAQFSPDGKFIVTVCGGARVWDARSGQLLNEIVLPGPNLESARFSPDSKRILTRWSDDTVRVYTHEICLAPVKLKHGEGVETAQFSPDGTRLVTTAYCNYTALMWDVNTGQPLTGPLRHSSAVGGAQFSRDGRRLVTVERITRVWDSDTGQRVAESPTHDYAAWAQFSPDGERVMIADESENSALVWDIAPSSAACPGWLLQLTEALCGNVLNQRNVAEPTKLDRVKILDQIRQRLNTEPNDDRWVVWGRWFLADPDTRTISPFSSITVPEYSKGRIEEPF